MHAVGIVGETRREARSYVTHSFALQCQIEPCVLGQGVQHVIKKPDARGDGRLARAIEIEVNLDERFLGPALHCRPPSAP